MILITKLHRRGKVAFQARNKAEARKILTVLRAKGERVLAATLKGDSFGRHVPRLFTVQSFGEEVKKNWAVQFVRSFDAGPKSRSGWQKADYEDLLGKVNGSMKSVLKENKALKAELARLKRAGGPIPGGARDDGEDDGDGGVDAIGYVSAQELYDGINADRQRLQAAIGGRERQPLPAVDLDQNVMVIARNGTRAVGMPLGRGLYLVGAANAQVVEALPATLIGDAMAQAALSALDPRTATVDGPAWDREIRPIALPRPA